MDKEQAYKIGLAFKLGMIYAKGKAHAKLTNDSKLALDDPKWITVHPNGKENKGRPALLDSETGEVLGGMGGKFNGKHISIANSKSNKSVKEQNTKKPLTEYEKAQKDIQNQLKALSKEDLIALKDKIDKTDANELIKKEKPLTEYEKAQNEIQNQLKGFSKEELIALRDKIDKTDSNELFKSENKQPAEKNQKAMTEQEYLASKGVGGAFSDYMLDKVRTNPNRTERAKKRFSKEADQARNDYFDKREQARKEYQEKISNGELRNKTTLEQRLEKAQGHEDNASTQSARRLLEKQGIDWRTGKALNAKGEETLRKYNQTVNNQSAENTTKANSFRDRAKEVLSKTNDFSKIDDKSVKNLPYQMLHEKALQVSKESRELGQLEEQIRKEKEESTKTQNKADTEQEHRDYNGALIDLQDRQKKLDYYSRVLNQEMRKRENNKTDNANFSDKAKKFYENQLNNKQTNTNPISLNDLSDPQKVSDYNKNVTRIVNKQLKDGGGLDKGDFTNIVNSMTDNEEVKKNALRGVNTSKDLSSWERNRENDYWAKYPENISLKNYEERGFDFSVPELNIGVWTKPQDLTPEQRKGMQEYLYKEYTKDKIRRLKLSKEDVKRLSQNNTTTANKTLSANKDNGSVASVLNVPDASKWNNKIYNYRNGEKAVFINNQKIVLNAEQYKKLKELAGK